MDELLNKEVRRFNIPENCRINFAELTEKVNRYGYDEEILHLPHKKIWFRMLFPDGKMTAVITKETDDYVIAEAKVYKNCSDPADNFIGEGTSVVVFQNVFVEKPMTALERYAAAIPLVKSLAIGKALTDAGFGLQFTGNQDNTDGFMEDEVQKLKDAKVSCLDATEESEDIVKEETNEKQEPGKKAKKETAKKSEKKEAAQKAADDSEAKKTEPEPEKLPFTDSNMEMESEDEKLPFTDDENTDIDADPAVAVLEKARATVIPFDKYKKPDGSSTLLGEVEGDLKKIPWIYANAKGEFKDAVEVIIRNMEKDKKDNLFTMFQSYNLPIPC